MFLTVLCNKVANASQSSGSAKRSFLVTSKTEAASEPGFGGRISLRYVYCCLLYGLEILGQEGSKKHLFGGLTRGTRTFN